MAYEIEKNVPVPRQSRNFPFDQMEVGDSFLVTCELPEDKKRTEVQIRNAFSSWKKKNEDKLVSCVLRSTDDGIRCWVLGAKN